MTDLPTLYDSTLVLDGRVATLTFDRDDVRNELTGTRLVDDIEAVARWVNAAPSVSVLIITGNGAAFSAGGNVKDMADRKGAFAGTVAEVEQKYRNGIQRIPLAMAGIEVPVIAAINGAAVGAGFDLACMCDIRFAASGAKLGEVFVNLGIIPGDGGAWFLQRLVGYQRAADLTFTGRIFTAEDALDMGLVLEVTERDRLMDRVRAYAADIAAKPSAAMRLTKRLMKMAQRTELKDFLDVCGVFQGMCHNSDEHIQAVQELASAIENKASISTIADSVKC